MYDYVLFEIQFRKEKNYILSRIFIDWLGFLFFVGFCFRNSNFLSCKESTVPSIYIYSLMQLTTTHRIKELWVTDTEVYIGTTSHNLLNNSYWKMQNARAQWCKCDFAKWPRNASHCLRHRFIPLSDPDPGMAIKQHLIVRIRSYLIRWLKNKKFNGVIVAHFDSAKGLSAVAAVESFFYMSSPEPTSGITSDI